MNPVQLVTSWAAEDCFLSWRIVNFLARHFPESACKPLLLPLRDAESIWNSSLWKRKRVFKLDSRNAEFTSAGSLTQRLRSHTTCCGTNFNFPDADVSFFGKHRGGCNLIAGRVMVPKLHIEKAFVVEIMLII